MVQSSAGKAAPRARRNLVAEVVLQLREQIENGEVDDMDNGWLLNLARERRE